MGFRHAIRLLALACCLVGSTGALFAKGEAPNILLLLADDMGYGELGCYGQEKIETPVLDELAKSGMRFTQFYSGTAVCSPSRASLMTGKHAGHATIRGNRGIFPDNQWERVPLRQDEKTLSEELKEAGYETAFIGKWHLDDPSDPSTWAFARGFDFSVQPQFGDGFDEDTHYFGDREREADYDWRENDSIDAFRTDIILEYLDQRSWDKPLFLFMSYRAPHPREQQIRDEEMYSDHGWPEKERVHAARITMLDEQIGRLMEKLRAKGELENTLVMFTSDNGGHNEGGHDYRFFESNGDLRGYKRDLYEGGIRVPMIAAWPGRVRAGSESDYVGAFCDIMPTFREVAGLPSRTGEDGISFLPTLLGRKQALHDYLYWEIQLDGWWGTLREGGFRQAARKGKWKAVRYGAANPIELYDLTQDASETWDLAASQPVIAAEMAKIMHAAHEETERFPFGGVPSYRPAKELSANFWE